MVAARGQAVRRPCARLGCAQRLRVCSVYGVPPDAATVRKQRALASHMLRAAMCCNAHARQATIHTNAAHTAALH
eukprot:15049743-Alexandrium_andersonii.AAC.1